VFFWGTLFLFFCLAVLLIAYGFQRARDDIGDASSAERPRTRRDPSRKAIQTGDLKLLKKVPQPKTLYDLFFDRVSQDFIIGQYHKLVKQLFPYLDDLSTRESMAEISNLTTDLTKMGIEADSAEEDLRRARAIREQEKLRESETTAQSVAPVAPRTAEVVLEELRNIPAERERMLDGITDNEQREKIVNIFDVKEQRLQRELQDLI
jgi:hypothetical protein